jgi:hypothetical protein
MPVTHVDTIDDFSRSKDAEQEVLTMGMFVQCPAGSDPMAEAGVPQPPSLYPGHNRMRLDRIDQPQFVNREAGVETYRLVLYYSTDRRFRFPARPQDLDLGEKDWELTYRAERQKIPAYQRIRRFRGDPNNPAGQPIGYDEWLETDLFYTVDFSVYNRLVVVTTFGQNDINIIESQKGRIHNFGGRRWRMLSPTIRRLSTDKVEIAYAWESDPGTPPFFTTLPSPNVSVPHERLPWFGYEVIPIQVPGDPVLGRPTVITYELYPPSSSWSVPNGYVALPGSPIP